MVLNRYLIESMGVPSRMNFGQVLEMHLGMAAKKLGIHVATPVMVQLLMTFGLLLKSGKIVVVCTIVVS